jgi:hypothetical protein
MARAQDQNKVNFSIRYDGPALSNHEMDIKDLAPALLSFGELLEKTNQLINGTDTKLNVMLRATEEGSIEIHLSTVQDFMGQMVSLLSGTGTTAIVNTFTLLQIIGFFKNGDNNLFNIIKWIKNRPVKTISKLEDGNCKIELANGEAKVCKEWVIKLFQNFEVRKRTESIVYTPLTRDGIDSVSFHSKEAQGEEVTKEEAPYFQCPQPQDQKINDTAYEAVFRIISLAFKEDNKWRLHDGDSAINVTITDTEFLKKISENAVAFSKDDILKCKVHLMQYQTMDGLKNEYFIEKILEHKFAARQMFLL